MEMIIQFLVFISILICSVNPTNLGRIVPFNRFNVLENQPIGYYVGTVQGTNCPTNKIYRLFPTNAPFSIDSNGGIFTTEILDRETVSFYRLIVQEICLGNTFTFPVFVLILDVNDNAPTFLINHDQMYLDVDSPVGTRVYRPIARDADAGMNGRIQFSLQQLDPPLFSIDQYTGLITLSAPMNARYRSRTLTIIATDGGIPPLSGQMRLQIHIRVR